MGFNTSGAMSGAVSGAGTGAMYGPWGAGIGAIGGGLLGGLMGGDAAAAKARKKAIEALTGINEQTGESAYAKEDPTVRNSQLAAMSKLQEMYGAGGMDPQSQAALREAQSQTAAQEQGTRGALTQNYASRGLSSSGAGLAARLANQQGGANRNAQAGAAAAGDARARALAAMGQAGQAAGAVRGQDYQRNSALDSIQQFNAGQRLKKGALISDAYTGASHDIGAENAAARQQGAGLGEFAGNAYGAYQDWRKKQPAEGTGGEF